MSLGHDVVYKPFFYVAEFHVPGFVEDLASLFIKDLSEGILFVCLVLG